MALTAYLEWNQAIVHAVTADIEEGLPVYLDTDEGRLGRIGVYNLGIESYDQASEAFLAAVRESCTSRGSVDLTCILGSDTDGLPKGVAFLASLVLSAYDMVEDDRVAANNFFGRLRERLALPTSEGGRPNGLDTGYEERLWRNWNQWLAARRWVPTAYPGQGALQFIQYARSQTLLRAADRQHLTNRYTSDTSLLQRARRWDAAQHLQWLGRRAEYGLTANLRSILTSPDPDRRSALGNAISELVEDLDPARASVPGRRLRRPRCGLYRSVHPLTGRARYLTFIQFPRDIPVEGAGIMTEAGQRPLHKLKGLWTKPLEVPDLLTHAQNLTVTGLPGVEEISIPERDHWVLVRDPDDPLHGDYATWRAPELGESFILLGRSGCGKQLDLLKEEGVLDWKDEPHEITGADDWLEWRECKILSPSWEHINPIHPELYDELRPSRLAIGIGFFGGLPGPHRGSWMQGHPPSVRSAVFGRCRMEIRSATGGNAVVSEVLIGEQRIELPSNLPADDYLLEVFSDDERQGEDAATPVRVRTLHITEWEDLSPGLGDLDVVTTLAGHAIQGATIRRVDKRDGEGASQ